MITVTTRGGAIALLIIALILLGTWGACDVCISEVP